MFHGARVCVYVDSDVCLCIFVHVYGCFYLSIYLSIYPHARTHTHTHTHTHTCMHACMHAQTHSPFPFPLKTLKGEDTHRTHL